MFYVEPMKKEKAVPSPDSQDDNLAYFLSGRESEVTQPTIAGVLLHRIERRTEHVAVVTVASRTENKEFELYFRIVEFPSGSIWLCCGPDHWFQRMVSLERLEVNDYRFERDDNRVDLYGEVRRWIREEARNANWASGKVTVEQDHT